MPHAPSIFHVAEKEHKNYKYYHIWLMLNVELAFSRSTYNDNHISLNIFRVPELCKPNKQELTFGLRQ